MEVNDRECHMSVVDLCDSCHAAARLGHFQITRISDRGQAGICCQTKAQQGPSSDLNPQMTLLGLSDVAHVAHV